MFRAQFETLVAFGAEALSPAQCSTFVADFVNRVLLEGHHLDSILHGILSQSQILAAHTTIWILSGKMKSGSWQCHVQHLGWHYPPTHPFGRRLPSQCPKCKVLCSWTLLQPQARLDDLQPCIYRCDGCKHNELIGPLKKLPSDKVPKAQLMGRWITLEERDL